MKVQLSSVSPISFLMIREGELLEIKRKPPKKNEFRGRLEAATESYLVFKSQTKIGMLPTKFVKENNANNFKNKCRINRVDKEKNIIIVEILLK